MITHVEENEGHHVILLAEKHGKHPECLQKVKTFFSAHINGYDPLRVEGLQGTRRGSYPTRAFGSLEPTEGRGIEELALP